MSDFAHHIQRIDQAHQRLDRHDGRLTSLEIDRASEAQRSTNIEQSLAKIESSITWLNRLVIGGIIAAAVGFIISGGLNVGS